MCKDVGSTQCTGDCDNCSGGNVIAINLDQLFEDFNSIATEGNSTSVSTSVATVDYK